ncbi:digestive organ expansion factor [Rickenella mellea]|uniref:U3 small nucleolar RNA-associated protein 25 n=1 Tax=Rickenella mellea TaxID=50990 RepID=A0A4Y7QG30_9AGAM|nr:digestive organ expansion factor [Rickenella mellea]
MDDGNSTTTKLLTLLNVSAVKAGKRRRVYYGAGPTLKLNKKKTVRLLHSELSTEPLVEKPQEVIEEPQVIDVPQETAEEGDVSEVTQPYELHFGTKNEFLTSESRYAVDNGLWDITRGRKSCLGPLIEYIPQNAQKAEAPQKTVISDKMVKSFKRRQEKMRDELRLLTDELLHTLASYQDLYHSHITLETKTPIRESIALHAFNHITKKRRRILKNNERHANASKSHTPSAPEDVQDQGFTRPSVLILLPFRSFALRWMEAITAHTPSAEYQIENHSRFLAEYGLPSGVTDKLETAPMGTYPTDHVEMFKGNIDDSFRVGVKMTKKSVKIFSDFYKCDLIMASPLGLRMSIEKDKNADFLSSIEILVVDQLDALSMQNWEHVQFVFSHLNKIPKETRDADFSRIKPWYLDGHAEYLRQTIMLSAYDTPEHRSMFNRSLRNVSGKLRTEPSWKALDVPEGVHQTFVPFDCSSPKAEADKRFDYFTTKMLPSVMKSAVQSTNTVLFVPSSFDFIRIQNHLRKLEGVSFAVLSEYTSNQDVSRARQAFYLGKKPILLVSERFHFFKRYKLRGIRNLIFYGPPDHPQFYSEFLSYPFLDDDVEASDISCRVLYCKYDRLRLERIAGTESTIDLLKSLP